MKRLFIFSLLFSIAVISASAQISAVFDRYTDMKDVNSVYISKTMIRMMGGTKSNTMFPDGLDKVDAIRILSTEVPKFAEKISGEVYTEVKKEKYEIIAQIKEDGDRTTIYQRTDNDGVNYFLIVVQEPSELNVISVTGSLTPEDIMKRHVKKNVKDKKDVNKKASGKK